MPLRSKRFILLASTAVQALLAFVLVLMLVLAPRVVAAQQVALSNTRSLDFGRFVAGSGGTITLSPSGLRSRTGGVVLLNSPNASQAAFSASQTTLDAGRGGLRATASTASTAATTAVIVSMPANGATYLTSGANSMAVGDFVTPDVLLAVGSSGTSLAVGATLVVAPNQPPGNYSGTFSVIVNHQ
jgi:hypothetical protein